MTESEYFLLHLDTGDMEIKKKKDFPSSLNRVIFIPLNTSQANKYSSNDLYDLYNKIDKPFLASIHSLIIDQKNNPPNFDTYINKVTSGFIEIKNKFIECLNQFSDYLINSLKYTVFSEYKLIFQQLESIFSSKYDFEHYFHSLNSNNLYESISCVYNDLFQRTSKNDDDYIQNLYAQLIEMKTNQTSFVLNETYLSNFFDELKSKINSIKVDHLISQAKFLKNRKVISSQSWNKSVISQKVSDPINFEKGVNLRSFSLNKSFLSYSLRSPVDYPYDESFAVISESSFYCSVWKVREPIHLKLQHSFSYLSHQNNGIKSHAFLYLEPGEKTNYSEDEQGIFIFGLTDNSLTFWSPVSGEPLLQIKKIYRTANSYIKSLIILKHRKEMLLLTLSSDGVLKIFDLVTMVCIKEFTTEFCTNFGASLLVNKNIIHGIELIYVGNNQQAIAKINIKRFQIEQNIKFNSIKIRVKDSFDVSGTKFEDVALIARGLVAIIYHKKIDVFNFIKKRKQYSLNIEEYSFIASLAPKITYGMGFPLVSLFANKKEKALTLSKFERIHIAKLKDDPFEFIFNRDQACFHMYLVSTGWKIIVIVPYMASGGKVRELKFRTICQLGRI